MVIVAVVMVVLICLLTLWGFLADGTRNRSKAPQRPVLVPQPVARPPAAPRPVAPAIEAPAEQPRLDPAEPPQKTRTKEEPAPPQPSVEPVPEVPQPVVPLRRPGPALPRPEFTQRDLNRSSVPWERGEFIQRIAAEHTEQPEPGPEPATPMTIVVFGADGLDASGVRGVARFEESHVVVVGHRAGAAVRLVYDVRAVELDHRGLLDAMDDRARDALQALRRKPADAAANRAFRAALNEPIVADFTVVAITDDRHHTLKGVRELGSLKIDLAGLLTADAALAEHLANPDSTPLRTDSLHGTEAAVDFHETDGAGDRLKEVSPPADPDDDDEFDEFDPVGDPFGGPRRS